MKIKRIVSTIGLCLCSLIVLAQESVLTLGDIVDKNPPPVTSIAAPSLRQLISDYNQLLVMSVDPAVVEQLRYRQAELVLNRNELAQEVGESIVSGHQGYYDSSIDAYRSLIQDYPDSEYAQHLYYQLAKAYDLQGEPEQSYQTIKTLNDSYPNNQYASELYFRSGEFLFAQQDYQLATEAYNHVVTEASSAYYQTSLYMMAWSYFKLDENDEALTYFSQLLDLSMPAVPTLFSDVKGLPKGDRQLVGDALDVMAIIFSSDKAAGELVKHYTAVGSRYYEYLVYEKLAQRYLDEKRYTDNALTYLSFVERYPDHPKSPGYAGKVIESYQQGGHLALAYQAKQDFVARYGISGPLWATWTAERRLTITDTLKSYLNEIAQDYYRAGASAATTKQKHASYTQAAQVLSQYINTFNDDENVVFLYAESLYASGQYTEAIVEYENYAYQPQTDYLVVESKRADAAYMALQAHRLLWQQESAPALISELAAARELSTLRFVESFKLDKRNLIVLEQLMNERFKASQFKAAIETAQQVITREELIGTDNLLAARILIAHSRFNLGQFAVAADNYDAVLGLINVSDVRHHELSENYAASLYEQAKVYIASEKLAKAVEWLVVIIEKAPNSSLRKVAQFNAAQYLYQLKEFERATGYLDDFRVRYSGDKLSHDIPMQIASIYEQQEDWGNAAIEYLTIADSFKDKTKQQQPLYLAALYFERAGENQKMTATYRRHAANYTRPFERAVEIRQKLAEIYQQNNQASNYKFWLNRLIAIHDNAGDQATSRSRALAASSALYFARSAQRKFNSAKLTLPLRRSLGIKKTNLKNALDAYKKASSYQVPEVTTESTHQMAQIYVKLAQDLMDSQRPENLDELALEQYEILLEEQAYPFEERAIAIFENNTQRSWLGNYDDWIKQSFAALATILPGRYDKVEAVEEDQNVIY